MPKFYTAEQVHKALRRALQGKTQAELAKEAGISPNFLSNVLTGGYPPTGKIVAFLGFEKVRERLYRRTERR